MRKHFSYILLIIVLFFSIGYHLYFKYLQINIQQNIKLEIRKGIDEKDLSIIVVTSENEKEIEWIKKGKEFRYKGSMYDVVKTETLSNKKIYYCIDDIKERNLITNYTKQNRKNNKTLLLLKKILSNKYFPENYLFNKSTVVKNISFSKYQSLYKSRFDPPSPPPPKFKFYI